MTVKEFLQTKTINISVVAKRVWPKNKTAELYLYKKLNGDRPFTKEDAEKIFPVLQEMCIQIEKLTIE